MPNLKKIGCLIVLFFFASFVFLPNSHSATNPRLSIDFKDADLKDVLKVLSQQSGLNFIASQAVQEQKVTLYLNDVTVDDALDKIVRANNLRYERDPASDIIVIYPITVAAVQTQTVRTRIFPIRYSRLSGSALGVGGDGVISELSTALSTSSGSSSSSSASSTNTSSATSRRRGIDEIVTSFLSSQGRLNVDSRTNSLVVVDLPDNLQIIEEIIRSLDIPSKQVMIEVHVLEVRASLTQNIGISYGNQDGVLASFAGGTRSTTFPFNSRVSPSFEPNPKVNALTATFDSITDGSARVTPSITLGTLSAANLSATLRLLTDQRDTKILARPRVLTINNEAAVIRLVTNTAIANTSTTSSSGGALGSTTSDVAERVETGIVLRMTPQINSDDSIELFLEPSVTTAAASSFFPATFLDPTTRSIRTTVRVQNGETLVIGGLIDKDISKGVRKVPILGDIPIIGYAFRSTDRDEVDRELLIFMTPHLIKESQPVEPLSGGGHIQAVMKDLLKEDAREKSSYKDRDVVTTFKEAEIRRTLAQLRQAKK